MSALPKNFDPSTVEAHHYDRWEEAGLFKCDANGEKQPFAMMMPPPNVTGSLHMGHAFQDTLMDIITRYWRMKGRDVLWQPGMDHAGIATQMMVERLVESEGTSRKELGREQFLERVWEWKEKSGGIISTQLRRLGVTPDWSRDRFTMDEGMSSAVRDVFVRLYKEGLIYKDKRLVNWDPKLQTAVSDLEVEQKEVKGHMWHIAYNIEGEKARTITVATTRPETLFGDSAIAVHPDDDRYKNLIGKFAALPLTDRLIPIIADEYADMEQGSGAVKITPAHDFNDFEVGKRNNLPMINIMDKNACLNDEVPDEFQGLDRFVARKKVLAELEATEQLIKVEDITHTVPYDEKSKSTVLEPYLTDQWYVDAKTLAAPALAAVKDGRTKFVPAQWENTYTRWMEDIRPWCISRQLWWGHRIPAWYDDNGNVFVAKDLKDAQKQAGEAVKLTQDEDVLDTWFSSALWPFSTLGWPNETPELAKYYPNDTLVTAFDIIFFWVARMMMMGIHLMGDVPFKTIYIHSIVRDANGQKMSKTRGNVIDPLVLCDKYGTDALRFTLAAMAAPGRDVKLSESRIAGYRNFATKLWNATRFCEMNGVRLCDAPSNNSVISKWILSRLDEARTEVEASVEKYQFNAAADAAYHFVWHTFCDWYVEIVKGDMSEDTKKTTGYVLMEILKLLNPFMPFITEEIFQKMTCSDKIIAAGDWLDALPRDKNACDEIDGICNIIKAVRSLRKDMNIPDKAQPNLIIQGCENVGALSKYDEIICRMARVSEISFDTEPSGVTIRCVEGGATLILPVDGLIDAGAEAARIKKEISKLDKDILKFSKKLENKGFLASAPQDVIEKDKEKLCLDETRRRRLNDALSTIEG